MKEKLTALFLVLIFIIFAYFQHVLHSKPVVLKLVTPTLIQVDLNGDSVIDKDENVCVNGIETFTANLQKFPSALSERRNLTFEKGVAIGYLTDEYANSVLLGSPVKLNFSGEKTPECSYADVYVNDKNYADLLFEHGFGIKNGNSVNEPAFKSIMERADKLKLAILNHKSLKYHVLNCKYGQAAHDAVVVLEKELPKDAKPCKYCHLSKYEKKQVKKTADIVPPPNIISDGNLKLILTDFTTILKPDKNCSHAVCKEFVNSIDSANKTIDIALYGWADIPKVNAAIERAKSRGVKFRIVYDTSSRENYYPETLDFIKRFENVRSDEVEGNKKLTNMLMHNKFAIFDGSKVYTGSMNFSTTGLSGFNHNAVIVINSKQIADLYTNEFNQMFEGKFHTLKSKSELNNNSLLAVYFSPQDKGLASGVVPLLNNAAKYIYIPTFILTHDGVYNAVLAAKARGVDVRIIIDATSTGVTHSKIKELRKAGISVKTENYAGKMHAKSMIIDDEYIVLGSANFSSSAENKNDENMLIVKNSKFARLYRDYFNYFWAKIPDKYLKYNVSPESKYSIGSCNDGVDNDFDGKIDSADEGCKKN